VNSEFQNLLKAAKIAIVKGAHQEEENEVDLKLPGRKGLED